MPLHALSAKIRRDRRAQRRPARHRHCTIQANLLRRRRASKRTSARWSRPHAKPTAGSGGSESVTYGRVRRLLANIGALTMTIEITIQVPDTLGEQLQRFQDRLPEVLERGLREVMADRADAFADERAVLALLASQPAPKQVLALHPTPELQERISELLWRSKEGTLLPQE